MADVVVNITPPSPITLAYSQGGAVGPQGPTGSTGPTGPTNRLVVGTVTSGTAASVTISAQTVANGTATQTINLVLPQGATGSQGIQGNAGPANVLSIGSVATTSATTAAVSISGTSPSQVISFVVPRGPQGIQGIQGDAGPFTTVKVGTTSTGAAGTNAKIETVTAGGTVTLNFTIPRGADASNLSDETPQPLGLASAGSAASAARADHVHSIPLISYGSLTGVPTSFSPSQHTHAISDVTNLQSALDSKQPSGAYATLVNGTVPSSMLPSYVDDVVDVGGTLPSTGEVGKIYVVSTGGSVNKIYRWSGSAFIEISPSPGSTDSVTEGSTNLYFTNARAVAAIPTASSSVAGIVKVGSGLSISSGVLSATGGGSGGDVDGGVYAAAAAPTGSDALWSSVRLLLPLNTNTNDFRSGQGSTVTAFGNAAIASSSPKFGAGSLFLDGSGDYLQVVDGFNYIVPGTGDFTIEAWVKPAFLSAEANYLFEARENSVAGYGVYLSSSGTVVVGAGPSSLITGAALSTGQWQHVALCRASGTLRLFINGSVAGTPVANTTNFASNRLLLGRSLSDSAPFYFDGNIDDVRYTSAARYTGTFTHPTEAHPTS